MLLCDARNICVCFIFESLIDIFLLPQKLISDERFHSKSLNELEGFRFPVQFLNTVISTPSLSDEVQVEVMKVNSDLFNFGPNF